MDTTPGSFSNGWHKERERRWQKWYDAIQRDPNYARILLNLPLIEPIRTEVRRIGLVIGGRKPRRRQMERNPIILRTRLVWLRLQTYLDPDPV